MSEHGYIVPEGQGGFLCPPTHPEHTFSVWCGPRNNPHTCMSLSSAVTETWLDETTRTKAKEKLDAWERPALESPAIQDWIHQVLGYFRGCYRGDGPEPQCWNAGNLKIGAVGRPVEEHAGVHLIRAYYPEFTPTADHFAGAYWGKKP